MLGAVLGTRGTDCVTPGAWHKDLSEICQLPGGAMPKLGLHAHPLFFLFLENRLVTHTHPQMMALKNHLLIPSRTDCPPVMGTIPTATPTAVCIKWTIKKEMRRPGLRDSQSGHGSVFFPITPVTSCVVCWLKQLGSRRRTFQCLEVQVHKQTSPGKYKTTPAASSDSPGCLQGSQSFQWQLNCMIGYRETFIIAPR